MFEKSIQTLSFFIISIVTIVLGIFFEKLQTTISIQLWILILIGLVVIYLTLTILKTERKNKELENNITLSEKLPNLKRKSISDDFVIDKINENQYEWSVVVRRSWLPTNKPDSEKFTKNVSLNEPICTFCRSDLLEMKDFRKLYLICPSEDCKGNRSEPFTKYTIDQTSILKLKELRGVIRINFDKYWNIYVKRYDEFTNKKYDDYWNPI